MTRKVYSTDLSDSEWAILAPLIPPAKHGGQERTTDMREVCNAIYYHLKTGCQWDMLPGDFPPSATVYSYYRKWQKRGIWEKMNHTLRFFKFVKKWGSQLNQVRSQQIASRSKRRKKGGCVRL